jgi:putative transposase
MRKHVCPEIWTEMFLLMDEKRLSPERIAKAMGVGVSTVYKKLGQHRNGGVKKRKKGSGRPRTYKADELKPRILRALEEVPPVAGYRRVYRWLKQNGFQGSSSAVYRLMKELELLTPSQRRRHWFKWRPIKASRPNEAWLMDTTQYHVGMDKFQTYLAIDAFSRRIFATASIYRNAVSTVDFLDATFNGAKPDKIYSDGGPEFDNYDVKAYLSEIAHVPWEKLPAYCPEARGLMERVVRTLKEEWLDWKRMHSYEDFKKEVEKFLHWYNNEREHSSLDYQTPMEVYKNGRFD